MSTVTYNITWIAVTVIYGVCVVTGKIIAANVVYITIIIIVDTIKIVDIHYA